MTADTAVKAALVPVFQTKFYDPLAQPDKQRGNCLSAVVASLLALSIEDVPNFVQDDVDTNGETSWWYSMLAFVRGHGAEVVFLRDEHLPDSTWPLPLPGEPYTVVGVSPRDSRIHHIVLYVDGILVHDPHPSGGGVLPPLSNDYRWTIRRTTALKGDTP